MHSEFSRRPVFTSGQWTTLTIDDVNKVAADKILLPTATLVLHNGENGYRFPFSETMHFVRENGKSCASFQAKVPRFPSDLPSGQDPLAGYVQVQVQSQTFVCTNIVFLPQKTIEISKHGSVFCAGKNAQNLMTFKVAVKDQNFNWQEDGNVELFLVDRDNPEILVKTKIEKALGDQKGFYIAVKETEQKLVQVENKKPTYQVEVVNKKQVDGKQSEVDINFLTNSSEKAKKLAEVVNTRKVADGQYEVDIKFSTNTSALKKHRFQNGKFRHTCFLFVFSAGKNSSKTASIPIEVKTETKPDTQKNSVKRKKAQGNPNNAKRPNCILVHLPLATNNDSINADVQQPAALEQHHFETLFEW